MPLTVNFYVQVLGEYLQVTIYLFELTISFRRCFSRLLIICPYLLNLDPINIAKEFSTGFLLGELLNKHGLQEDFSFFSQNM